MIIPCSSSTLPQGLNSSKALFFWRKLANRANLMYFYLGLLMVQLLSLSDRIPSLFFLVHMHMTNDSFFHYYTMLPHSQWQNQKETKPRVVFQHFQKKTREAGRRTWWSRTRNVSKLFSFPGLEGIDQPKWHYLVSILDLILLKGREVGLFFLCPWSLNALVEMRKLTLSGREVGNKLVACLVVPGYTTLPR